MKFPSASAVVRAFRLLAVAEAFSWAALLTGMYFKWIAGTTELGVEIAGPVHGALFIGYGSGGPCPVAPAALAVQGGAVGGPLGGVPLRHSPV